MFARILIKDGVANHFPGYSNVNGLELQIANKQFDAVVVSDGCAYIFHPEYSAALWVIEGDYVLIKKYELSSFQEVKLENKTSHQAKLSDIFGQEVKSMTVVFK